MGGLQCAPTTAAAKGRRECQAEQEGKLWERGKLLRHRTSTRKNIHFFTICIITVY